MYSVYWRKRLSAELLKNNADLFIRE